MSEQKWPERLYAWFDRNDHLRTGLSKRGKASEFRDYIPAESVQEVAERAETLLRTVARDGGMGTGDTLRCEQAADDLAHFLRDAS